MARNRVIYQSEALYVGPTDATNGTKLNHTTTNVHQIQRVQSANYSFNLERQDVNQFGELASIDRVILSAPTISLDFSYLVANLYNESGLGFTTMGDAGASSYVSCIKGFLDKTSDEKNYFIKTVKEGSDEKTVDPDPLKDGFSETTAGNLMQSTIGIGNGFITSYTAEGSVGNFPTATVNVEALNMVIQSGASGIYVPSVNPADGSKIVAYTVVLPTGISNPATYGHHGNGAAASQSVLRPGNVTVSIVDNGSTFGNNTYNEMGVLVSDAKIQSYNISFDLGRTPLEKLGSKFAFSREIDFPVTITASLEANVGELTTGNLADMIPIDQNYDLFVRLKEPTDATIYVDYHIKKAKLDSQEFSSAIGDNKSVTLNFSAQVGGPNQTDVGFFMSGIGM